MGEDEVDYDEIIREAKEEGIKEVTKNEDGSVTYKMSKAKHKEIMKEMNDEILEYFDEIVNDEDIASIKDISSNKSFTKVEVIVDRDKFENSLDGFAVLGIAFQSMFYQVFDGVNPDEYKTTVNYKDAETQKIFDTIVYPDVFDEK